MVGWFVVALVAVAIWAAVREARLRRDAVEASFAAIVVQTPQGLVPCDRLRIVREVIDSAGSDGGASDCFRYCVGPGPSYFLLIAQGLPAQRARRPVQWVVRPLSEERMRGALHDDPRALAAAFGDRGGLASPPARE